MATIPLTRRGAEKLREELARLKSVDRHAVIQAISPRLLLLDEVFEALDHEFRAIVEEFALELRERGGIVVAAGHDHAAMSRMCPQALLLDRGHARAHGPFAEVIGTYRGPEAAGAMAEPATAG